MEDAYCPTCGEPVVRTYLICPNCGEFLLDFPDEENEPEKDRHDERE